MTVRAATNFLALAIGFALPACVEPVDETSTEQALQPPPTSVMAMLTSPTRMNVTWDSVPGALKYYVYRSAAGGPYTYVATTRSPATSAGVAGLALGTEYCFEVKTDDGAGTSDFSAPGCAMTPGAPTAPASVLATPTSASRMTVDWPAEAGASKYFVYQSTGSAGPFDLVGTVIAPGATFAARDLLPSTTYCYKVATSNPNGTSQPSTEMGCAKTFHEGLEASYKLEDTGAFAEDHSGNGRNGLITGGASYSSDGAPLDGHRQSLMIPGAVTDGVSIADAAPFWMTGPFSMVAWVKLPGAAGTSVRIAGKRVAGCGAVTWELAQDAANGLHVKGRLGAISASGTSIPVGVWTHVAITYSGAGGTLRIYVNGVEVSSGPFTPGSRTSDPLQLGNSGSCGSAPVMIDAVQIHSLELDAVQLSELGTRPVAPANLAATVGCATRVDLTWDEVPGASKYFIYRGAAPGNEQYVASVRAPATTYTDGHLAPSQNTAWFVRSVQNGIYSEASNPQLVTTFAPPAVPTGVIAAITSSGRIQVDWDAVPGATKYYVYESVAGAPFGYRSTVLGGNPTTFRSGAVLPGTAYAYKVRVEVPCASSGDSAEASVTTP